MKAAIANSVAFADRPGGVIILPLTMESQMIHHVSLGTADVARAKAFYDPLMSLIGFRLMKRSEGAIHYGASPKYYGAFVRDPDGNKIEAVTYTARESFGLS